MKFMRDGSCTYRPKWRGRANISPGNRRRRENAEGTSRGFLYKLRIFDSAHKIFKARMSEAVSEIEYVSACVCVRAGTCVPSSMRPRIRTRSSTRQS